MIKDFTTPWPAAEAKRSPVYIIKNTMANDHKSRSALIIKRGHFVKPSFPYTTMTVLLAFPSPDLFIAIMRYLSWVFPGGATKARQCSGKVNRLCGKVNWICG
ncbi:MAG: hypothetical protein J7M40_03175 [Planctomycetes bacterium]|nr:hypothetical protein [Planctomycetota bacterium]